MSISGQNGNEWASSRYVVEAKEAKKKQKKGPGAQKERNKRINLIDQWVYREKRRRERGIEKISPYIPSCLLISREP